jgi:translocation and assembly module TamB
MSQPTPQASVSTQPTAVPVRGNKSVWLWLRLSVLSALLLLSSVLALFGSSPGLQLLWLLQPQLLPALQIQQVSGDLWQGVRIRQLQYQQPDLQVAVAELTLKIDLNCLWQRQLCLPLVQVTQLQVNQTRSESIGTTSPTEPAANSLQLPLSVSIGRLELSDSTLQLPAQHMRLGHLQTAVDLTVDRLTLQSLTLANSRLSLQKDQSNSAATNPMPTLLQLQLPLELALPDLHVTDFTLQQDQHPLLQLQSLQTDVLLSANQWQLQNTQLRLQQPVLQASGDLLLDRLAQQLALQLQLEASHAQLSAPVKINIDGRGALAAWQLQLNSTSPWPLELELKTDLLSPALAFQGTLHGDALHWPWPAKVQMPVAAPADPQSATAIATKPAPLPADLTLRQLGIQFSGDLHQQQLALSVATESPALPQAEWTLSARQHQGVVELSALQLRTLNGQADLSGTLKLNTLDLTAALQLNGIQPGLYWADYPGEISGQVELAANFAANATRQWQLHANTLQLNGELRGQPLLLDGKLTLQQPRSGLLQLETPGLKLQHGPNLLQLNGALAEQLTLDATLHIADLAHSLALAEGEIDANFQLRGDLKKPDLHLNLRARQLSYLDDYSLAELTASATLPAMGEKSSQISLNAKNGQAPGWQLQQLDWQSEGTQQQHQTHLTLDSHQLKAVLAMQAGIKDQQWRANVQEFRLQSDMGDWQLQNPWPVRLDLARQQAELGTACWLQADASMCLSKTKLLSTKQGELALQLQQLPLNSLDPILPPNLSLEGSVSGQLAVNWLKGRLSELSWQLQSTTGLLRHQLTTPLDLPWHDLRLSGGLKDFQLTSNLQATLSKDSAIAANVDIKALNSAAPTVKANLQLAPLSLTFLQPVFNEYSKFDGLLSANLRAEGALGNPAIYGSLAIDALQLTGQQAPLELTKANLLASFRGFAASLNSDWQTPEGRLSVTGDANWLTPDAWFSQIDVKGDKLQLQLTDAELTVSPQLRLTASPHSGQVSGNIDIPAGNIRFNSLPENATKVSADEIVISAQQRAGEKSNWTLSSDIRLKIGEQVRLAAFGLKTRLQGDLRVRQQGMVPTLHGQVQLKDGSFRAYGQDLKLRKGRLTFNGPASQPLLSIEAIRNPEKTEDNVIAGLRVNGLADNPLVEVFSEPSKPQANALAYLLLGRDIGSSAGDGAVTTGLIGIGIANSGQLVGAIGEAFGISDLSLDTAGSGDKSKVTVSGYLSPRLQVKYGVGIFSQFGEFTLRYRLMQQVYVEAVQGLATSVDVLYKMEFD